VIFANFKDLATTYKLNRIVPKPDLNEILSVKAILGCTSMFFSKQ